MSGSFSRSWLRTVQTTCVSLTKPGNEERPQRPIDQPRDQGLLFGWPALALEEAARDLSGCEGLLLIIDRERKEILTRLCRSSSPPQCTRPWFRHKWRAPRHRLGGRSSRSRARDGVRPTSAPYDKHGTFGIILFGKLGRRRPATPGAQPSAVMKTAPGTSDPAPSNKRARQSVGSPRPSGGEECCWRGAVSTWCQRRSPRRPINVS